MMTVKEKIQSAKLLHWSSSVKAGDVLKYWHDDGRHGVICYARVLKVCPRKLKVRGERGEIGYKNPGWFTGRLSEREVYELNEQGVSI
mgnify:FL=1